MASREPRQWTCSATLTVHRVKTWRALRRNRAKRRRGNQEAAAQRAREAQQAAADRAAGRPQQHHAHDRGHVERTAPGRSGREEGRQGKAGGAAADHPVGIADETINSIDQLIVKDKQGNPTGLAEGTKYIVGGLRLPALVAGSGFIPKATAAKAAFDNLKARLVIDLIAEMKSQSKTGATGFGQLNEGERQTLEHSIGRLDTAQDEKTFYTELLRIREKIAKIKMPAPRPVDGTTVTIDFRKSGS
jgi:hypothetical protein